MSRRLGGAGVRRGLRTPPRVSAAAPWSPLDDAGLQSWYDPSDPTARTLDGSTLYEALADKGPLSRESATQPSGLARPAVGTLGGRDALSLAGAQWLRATYASSIAQPYTIIAVVDLTGAAATHVVSDNDAGNPASFFFSTGTWRMQAGLVADSGDATKLGMRAHACIFNGSSSAYYLDDFGTAAASGINAGTNALTGRTLGASRAAAGPSTGLLGDHIITTSTDLATLAQYAAWLTARYTGLTVTT